MRSFASVSFALLVTGCASTLASPRSADAPSSTAAPSTASAETTTSGGRAVVSVEVGDDGSIGEVVVRRESPVELGFGDACVRMVRSNGPWTPATDANGRNVASTVRFVCDFTIDD